MVLNTDQQTVQGFGEEWSFFDQSSLDEHERQQHFENYFEIFPWKRLPKDAVGFDLGCGSGRWAQLAAQRIGHLHCIDASAQALEVARKNLTAAENCSFHCASVESIPLADNSMDFGYSLGVLHHVPDTEDGIKSCVAKLKPGAPFLVYLYYAFDNRPLWFKLLWRLSDLMRRAICQLPFGLKRALTDIIALLVYFPLARSAAWAERRGLPISHWPLSAYRHVSFYMMRTDALDRFGTRLEKRFTLDQIKTMMHNAGLKDVQHSRKIFWCVVGTK